MGFKVYNKTFTKPYLFHDVPPVTIEPMINAHKTCGSSWHMRVGIFLGLPQIYKSLENLDEFEKLTKQELRVLLWLSIDLKISKIRRISSSQSMM